MNIKTKLIIEKYISYIEDEQFDELYAAAKRDLYDYKDVSDLTMTLLSAGIDPSLKMSSLPSHYMYHVDTVDSIKLPASINTLGEAAFSGMLNLKTLDLSSCISLKQIPECLCMNSLDLETVMLPDTIQSIDSYAFADCHKLNKINLSNTITELWGGCFQRCSSLTSVHIPSDKLTVFGAAVFDGCSNLKDVTFDSSSRLNILPARLFQDCSSLEEVELPEGIQRIRMLAFKNCVSLHTVHLPSSLETIESSVFNNCPKLRRLIYKGTSDEFMKIENLSNISVEVICTDKIINI